MAAWYIFSILVAGLILSGEYYGWRTGVPTVASFRPARRKIVDFAKQCTGTIPSPSIIDLGSGYGQLAAMLAREMPQANLVGIEISPAPWLFSWLRQKLTGPSNASFRRTDFFAYDISRADVVIVFLTENIIDRVTEKLRNELKPGAYVIANETPLHSDWQPAEIVELDFMKIKIYLYRQD
jgi:SAM-dependent methyltransferase